MITTPEVDSPPSADAFQILSIDLVTPSPTNPRKKFDETKLVELADSIRAHGLIQPVTVRPLGDGYELVAGERRYRASKIAGIESIPAMVRNLSDAAVLEIQVIENNQREDVHPLEETEGFRRLLDSGAYGTEKVAAVEKLAEKIGRTVSYVYQRLKLADLIPLGREAMLDYGLTAAHAILIARLPHDAQVKALAYTYGWSTCPEKELAKRITESTNRLQSVRNLSAFIAQEIFLKLGQAPFDINDADLLPVAGNCARCAKRTGFNNALFEDVSDGDCCLDRECFEQKVLRGLEKKFQETEQALGPTVKISLTYYIDGYKGKSKPLLNHEYKIVDQGACGSTKPGLVVHLGHSREANLGDVKWICADSNCKKHHGSSSAYQKSDEEKAAEKELARHKVIEKETRQGLVAAMAHLSPKEFGRSFAEDVLAHLYRKCHELHDKRFADRFGWTTPEKLDYNTNWHELARRNMPAMTDEQLMQLFLEIAWKQDLDGVYGWELPLKRAEALESAAAAAGVDVDLIRREAEERHPKKEPKEKKIAVARTAEPMTAEALHSCASEPDCPAEDCDEAPPIEQRDPGDEHQEEASTPEEPEAKRGRGRPKGSKSKAYDPRRRRL